MQLCHFNFLMRIWAVWLYRSFTGFVPELFITQVQRRITQATEQPTESENSCIWSCICNDTFKSISFQISQDVKIMNS